MSADVLITALIASISTFMQRIAPIGKLEALDVIESEYFLEHDPDEAHGLEQIRVELRSDLQALRAAIDSGIEIFEMHVRGAVLYITGGLSTGDGPTEIWDGLCRLRAVRGVFAAVGFERESDVSD
jgi:hypothetical protein